MAHYSVDGYANAVIVNPKFATHHPDAVKGFLLREIAQEHRDGPGGRGRCLPQPIA
jgi:hypothetical protein